MAHLVLWLVLATAGAPQGGIGGGVSGLPQAPQPRDPRAVPVTGTGSISGRVTAADTGAPIRRALVNLTGAATPSEGVARFNPRKAVFTDHEGRYQFTDLPQGRYSIFASPGAHRADYLALPYGARISSATGRPMGNQPIHLTDGQQLENVDVALPQSGVITGTVLDAAGQPLARIGVTALLLQPGAEPMQRAGASTDDRGRYRIFGLPPGDYLVRANPQPGGMPTEIEGEPTSFAPTYAPGTPALSDAMRIRLQRGGEAPADIQLLETRVFKIAGMLVNSKGELSRNSSVMLAREGDLGASSFGASVSPAGEFTFRNVPPGSYEIVARFMPQRDPRMPSIPNDPEQEYAAVMVEVGMADVENVLISTRPGATLTGQMVFDGPVSEGQRANVFVQNPERRHFMPSPLVEAKGDTFTLKNVFTPILLRGSLGRPGWGLKAVLLRGRDITDEPVAFTEKDSGHLQVVFTSTAPSLEGAVTDDAGKPVGEAAILLFGEDPSTWSPHSSFFRRGGLGKEGRYKLEGLREGRYFAVAIPVEFATNMAQPNRAFLEDLAKVATRLILNAGETRTVDLPLIRFEQ